MGSTMSLIEIFTVGFMVLALPASLLVSTSSPAEIAAQEGGDYDEEYHP